MGHHRASRRGELKGWALAWLDGMKAKWFAWSAEYPKTTIYDAPQTGSLTEKPKMIAGTAEFLRAVPKRFATVQAIILIGMQITLLTDGESDAKTWTIEPDAEIKRFGWWGRLEQFRGWGSSLGLVQNRSTERAWPSRCCATNRPKRTCTADVDASPPVNLRTSCSIRPRAPTDRLSLAAAEIFQGGKSVLPQSWR